MLRHLALRAIEMPWLLRALLAARQPGAVVLFLHRFSADGEQAGRYRTVALRQLLLSLRKAGVALVGLEEAIGYATGSVNSRGRLAVSITVDDGYADFAELGWPVFKEFDCPASLFVVPGVIDGAQWFWWDRLDWLMHRSPVPEVVLNVGVDRFHESWGDRPTRHRAYEKACEWLKRWPADGIEAALRGYEQGATARLPERAPEEYRVLGWPELRDLEQDGVRIGAHSMTHPVLSLCDEVRMHWEITESVRQVAEHIANPLPVFCYPNGKLRDHGVREWQALRQAAVPFAMTTTEGVLRGRRPTLGDEYWRYQLPRVSCPGSAGEVLREFFAVG